MHSSNILLTRKSKSSFIQIRLIFPLLFLLSAYSFIYWNIFNKSLVKGEDFSMR